MLKTKNDNFISNGLTGTLLGFIFGLAWIILSLGFCYFITGYEYGLNNQDLKRKVEAKELE